MEIQLQDLKSSLEEKETRLKEMEEKISALSKSDGKDNRIAELESKVEEMKIKFTDDKYNKEVSLLPKENSTEFKELTKELENKVKENEHLKDQLKRRTHNLQELVNKELWDKNKEIEKLNKLCEHWQTEIGQLKQQLCTSDKQVEIRKDMNSCTNVMSEICLMKSEGVFESTSLSRFPTSDTKLLQEQLLNSLEQEKNLSTKVEELTKQLQNIFEQNNDSCLLQTLQAELVKAKQGKEAAESSHKDMVSICLLLTSNLQNVSKLLESLLPSLDAERCRLVRNVAEHIRQLMSTYLTRIDDTNLLQNLQNTPLLPDFSTVDLYCRDNKI